MFKLKNGLSVLLLPDRALPIMSIQLLLPVGAIDDPPDRVGLADFTASMLRQGTRRHSADALSEVVDSAGISLSASSSYESTNISCSGRSSSTGLCLQMVADLALRPTFPAKEMHESSRSSWARSARPWTIPPASRSFTSTTCSTAMTTRRVAP